MATAPLAMAARSNMSEVDPVDMSEAPTSKNQNMTPDRVSAPAAPPGNNNPILPDRDLRPTTSNLQLGNTNIAPPNTGTGNTGY